MHGEDVVIDTQGKGVLAWGAMPLTSRDDAVAETDAAEAPAAAQNLVVGSLVQLLPMVGQPIPLPITQQGTRKPSRPSIKLLEVACDSGQIHHVIKEIFRHSSLSISEVARRMGVDRSAIQYHLHKPHVRPSLWWVTKFATVCGSKIVVEFPERTL